MKQYPHIQIRQDSISTFISNISIIASKQEKKELEATCKNNCWWKWRRTQFKST